MPYRYSDPRPRGLSQLPVNRVDHRSAVNSLGSYYGNLSSMNGIVRDAVAAEQEAEARFSWEAATTLVAGKVTYLGVALSGDNRGRRVVYEGGGHFLSQMTKEVPVFPFIGRLKAGEVLDTTRVAAANLINDFRVLSWEWYTYAANVQVASFKFTEQVGDGGSVPSAQPVILGIGFPNMGTETQMMSGHIHLYGRRYWHQSLPEFDPDR